MTARDTITTNTQPDATDLTIAGINEPIILRYFETLNAEEFAETAALFAVDGVLNPPFESGIVGPEAIATYLQTEAKGMQLQPREGEIVPAQEEFLADFTEIKVTGKVQTSLFGVNVAWRFVLNSHNQIASVTIRLLASPKELLNLRR